MLSLITTRLLLSWKYQKIYCNIYINKVGFAISLNRLCFNMGPQWQIYFWQNIQLGFTLYVLEASMELATCNNCVVMSGTCPRHAAYVAPRYLVCAWGRWHVWSWSTYVCKYSHMPVSIFLKNHISEQDYAKGISVNISPIIVN